MAEKIAALETLSLRDAGLISHHATVPLLAGLVSLDAKVRNRGTPHIRLRPLFYIPLAQTLEGGGFKGAADFVAARLLDLDRDIALEGKIISVALDRWSGRFSFSELSQTLILIRDFELRGAKLQILGPSTVDIAQLLDSGEADGESDMSYLEQVLTSLQELGISSIEGGSDLDLHREAALLGFDNVFSHELSLDSKAHAELFSSGTLPRDSRTTEFTREFLQEFTLIRSEVEPLGHLNTWFPWTAALLDHESGKAIPIAVQVLRAIALGRLMFPEVPYIRAPLSALGLKVAHVALEFGANDLGFAAVDAGTERALGVARISDTETIVREHQAVSQVVI